MKIAQVGAIITNTHVTHLGRESLAGTTYNNLSLLEPELCIIHSRDE